MLHYHPEGIITGSVCEGSTASIKFFLNNLWDFTPPAPSLRYFRFGRREALAKNIQKAGQSPANVVRVTNGHFDMIGPLSLLSTNQLSLFG